MRLLFITHADFEKPGSIETWAINNGYVTKEVQPFKGEKLPETNTFDFLVVMGGPQSPLKMDDAAYLRDEIELIKQSIKENKRIIGVCLGAQLIGEAFGAKTEHSPNREIGVYPVELTDEASNDPLFKLFPRKFHVMHWHSDMPGLSRGAKLLAASEGCPRQIIRYGERIYGFQCHFELTQPLVEEMIKKCGNDLKSGKYIRTIDELMTTDYQEFNAKMDKILSHLADVTIQQQY